MSNEFTSLVREMEALRRHLNRIPDNHEWTGNELSELDDVRHAALNLSRDVEAIFDSLQGKEGGK